jgi:hypothetical protein
MIGGLELPPIFCEVWRRLETTVSRRELQLLLRKGNSNAKPRSSAYLQPFLSVFPVGLPSTKKWKPEIQRERRWPRCRFQSFPLSQTAVESCRHWFQGTMALGSLHTSDWSLLLSALCWTTPLREYWGYGSMAAFWSYLKLMSLYSKPEMENHYVALKLAYCHASIPIPRPIDLVSDWGSATQKGS